MLLPLFDFSIIISGLHHSRPDLPVPPPLDHHTGRDRPAIERLERTIS
jgi:hypothetical protein